MSFVLTQSLSKLLCVTCKKYLSHFPIYLDPKKGSFCGRCQQPSGKNVVRNEPYELIAQTQKFPCCYNSYGCNEHLVPSKIPYHELFCSYMQLDCPKTASTDCEWHGSIDDLQEHFEDKHPTSYLPDGRFELDFINTYRETSLLSYMDGLYILRRSNDSKTKTITFNVEYVGTQPHATDSRYEIILENNTKSQSHEIRNKFNVKTDINIATVISLLNNPSAINATVEILECEDIDTPLETEDEDEENKDLNYDLLKELECSVCFEYMLPPIHQCVIGHSICLKCRNSVKKCPTCRAEYGNTQNFTLGQVINYITFPCKNKRCKFTANAKDIRQHQASCIYGLWNCPFREYEDCNEDIIFSEMYDHISNEHSENLLQYEIINVPFNEDEKDEDCYILTYACRLFKLHYKHRNGMFYWAMQLIGPPEESVKYMFDIDIIDNSGKHKRAYFKSVCSPVSENINAFDDNNFYIYMDEDQIRSMITENFTYRVRVTHEE